MAGGGTGKLHTGSFTVARIDADGSDPHHVSIFQDEPWEDALDFEGWPDTDGGMTPWDEATDIVAVGDALVADLLLILHGSSLSRVGASGKSGAVQ
jgi:hypothetical protein